MFHKFLEIGKHSKQTVFHLLFVWFLLVTAMDFLAYNGYLYLEKYATEYNKDTADHDM